MNGEFNQICDHYDYFKLDKSHPFINILEKKCYQLRYYHIYSYEKDKISKARSNE